MRPFNDCFTQIHPSDTEYDSLDYWQSKHNPKILVCVAPPTRRSIKYTSNLRPEDALPVSIPLPYQLYIVRLEYNLSLDKWRFQIPYLFFASNHPKSYSSMGWSKLFSPWIPNLLIEEYSKPPYNDSYTLNQYNCLGSDSLWELKSKYKESFKLDDNNFANIIQSYYKFFIDVYFSGIFNHDLATQNDLNPQNEFNIYDCEYDSEFAEDTYLKWFDPSWSMKEVVKSKFLNTHANPSYKFEDIVDYVSSSNISMSN